MRLNVGRRRRRRRKRGILENDRLTLRRQVEGGLPEVRGPDDLGLGVGKLGLETILDHCQTQHKGSGGVAWRGVAHKHREWSLRSWAVDRPKDTVKAAARWAEYTPCAAPSHRNGQPRPGGGEADNVAARMTNTAAIGPGRVAAEAPRHRDERPCLPWASSMSGGTCVAPTCVGVQVVGWFGLSIFKNLRVVLFWTKR